MDSTRLWGRDTVVVFICLFLRGVGKWNRIVAVEDEEGWWWWWWWWLGVMRSGSIPTKDVPGIGVL